MAMMRPAPGSAKGKGHKRLGALLIEDGAITQQQLDKALEVQGEKGGYLGGILVDLGHLTQERLTEFLSRQCQIPHVSLIGYEINDQVTKLLPKEICLRLNVLPIDRLARIITLAMVNPLDAEALEEVQKLCPDLRIKPILCSWGHFKTVTERLFSETPVLRVADYSILSREHSPAKPKSAEERAAEQKGRDAGPGLVDEGDEAVPAPSRPPTRGLGGGLQTISADSARQIGSALSEGLQESLAELLTALREHRAAPAQTDPADTLTELTAGLRESMETSIQSLAGELRASLDGLKESWPQPPADGGEDRLAGLLREQLGASVSEAMQPLTAQIAEVAAEMRRGPEKDSAPDFVALAQGIQDGVGAAVGTALASVSAELRSLNELQQRVPDGPTPSEWAEAASQSVGAVVRDAMEQLGENLRATLAGQAESREQSGQELAKLAQALQEGVAHAVEDSMAGMAVQLKDALARGDSADEESRSQAAAALAERLAEAVNRGLAELRDAQKGQESELARVAETALAAIASESRNALTAQQEELARIAETTLQSIREARETQESQQSQLAKIAEAASQSVKQTTELIESHLVAESNRRDLMRRRKNRHASVAPFGLGPDADPDEATRVDESDGRIMDALDSEIPLESLTFENYFPGKVNAFTFKVAQAVATAPGGDYNPLFLYGTVGCGKTHLISAIGNTILTGGGKKSKGPAPRVGYVSASHFARRLADAVAEGALDAFRENYCHWDVLILDDIQFLGGRVEAQEEFFHIFNALHQQGRQIIIAADKAPDRLGLLEQRLISRFASGIVAELKPPEWETRMQILKHQMSGAGVPVPEEILSLIAMRVPGDVRKMIGALRKITAFARLIGKEISVEMAQEILSHLGAEEAA
ncbi:MAG TPA: DnaA/Hda family protein [Candidatus Hydrogenedentes bacterium]|nr:DnaA/Hda family protein [Candidatus Hydrogenedentota bacterium]HQL93550.1 DnaA/Hda family protein [Candidatus Hydrogenedentota bacterium]